MQSTYSKRVILWGTFIVVLAAVAVVIFMFRTEIASLLGFAPPPCGEAQLAINSEVYRIQTIKPAKDGSITVPSNKPGTAYWVEDTTSNYVFFINDDLTLMGGAAKITWADCNSTAYVLYEPEPGVPDNATLLDQSTSRITIVVQNSKVITGSLIGEEINVFNTPDPAEILAEVSLLETTTSAGKATITVSVSIANQGPAALTVRAYDVALLVNNAPRVLTSSEPTLPKEIAAGATETFAFTFARPNTPTATLKVFSVEYDLEGY